jgi:tripartite ATP-independent transporter DctM subunit
MSTDVVTWISLVMMAVLLFSGMPIFVALGVTGLVGLLLLEGVHGLTLVPMTIYSNLDNFVLVAIPLFIFMAQVMVVIGLGADLFTAAQRWLSRVPGGLAAATTGACTVFAAMSGSMASAVAGIGAVAVPEMTKRGYSQSLAAGCVCSAGGLASIIPPSIAFIIYGWLAKQSVAKLFIAGIIPGLLLATAMLVCIFTWVRLRPEAAPPAGSFSWRERLEPLKKVWPAAVLIFIIMGSIYSGIATPTEAAAVGATTILLLGFLFYRNLRWHNFKIATTSAVRVTSQIGLILVSAMLFANLTALLGLPQKAAEIVSDLSLSPTMLVIIIGVFFFIAGFFFDEMSVFLIVFPIILPILQEAGVDLIWFGVLSVINIELSTITPPFAINLYILKGTVPELAIGSIIRGVFPFIAAQVCILGVLIAFPTLSLWLPGMMD